MVGANFRQLLEFPARMGGTCGADATRVAHVVAAKLRQSYRDPLSMLLPHVSPSSKARRPAPQKLAVEAASLRASRTTYASL